MLFSVNYSQAAADLYRAGDIKVDLFKCPAWPDVIKAALEVNDVYVHFPLNVGTGSGDALNMETGEPADWGKIEELLVETGTPVVNLHLGPTAETYPDIPVQSTDPAHIELLTEHMIVDLKPVLRRFGAEHVVLENIHAGIGRSLRPAYVPEVISRVVEETGSGFLLDLSHAQLAAKHLGVDIYNYIRALPTGAIREIHLAGMQRFEGRWIEIAKEAGFDQVIIGRYRGQLVDHLPMTERDWAFFSWSLEQIRSGKWGRPWVITFEYGGVRGKFAPITDGEVIREQVPRLYELVKGFDVGPQRGGQIKSAGGREA